MEEVKENIIRPQEGFQMNFISSSADIVIGGAAAGVGKTFALLIEFLRHINNTGWGGVVFRRTSPQIRLEGGLWDTSMKLYPNAGASPRESSLEWVFQSKAKLKFSHLEYEKNILDWQGSQIPFLAFDELTHFTEKMFFYLLTRNRSTCGVKPYVRATCNPDPESWVAKLISWWIDEETGFPIKERDGIVRYFIRSGDNYIWGNSEEEVIEKAKPILEKLVLESGVKAKEFVKSITFISGSIYDNKELLKVNPAYLANLLSQDEATKNSLLDGNWKFVTSDKDIYNYSSFLGMFENVFQVPNTGKRITADIALKGSNKFLIGYWEGRYLIDIRIVDKSDGKQVIESIKELAIIYKVPNNKILFDADGVGGFVDGFLVGSIPFHGGSSVIKVLDELSGKNIKENYFNLKTQLIYRSGNAVNNDLYKVSEKVANTMYDDKMTVKQRFIHERKAFKRANTDSDGKLKVISKDEMKIILQNESPDLMDMFFMNEFFEIQPKTQTFKTDEKTIKSINY